MSPIERLRSKAREHTEKALNVIIGIMNSKAVSAETRLKAADMVLDRGFGRPSEVIETQEMQVARRIVREIVHVKETRDEIDNHDLVIDYKEVKANGGDH